MALVKRRDLLITDKLAAPGLRAPLSHGGLLVRRQPVRPYPIRLDGEQDFQRLLLRLLRPGGEAVDHMFQRFVHAVINHFQEASAIEARPLQPLPRGDLIQGHERDFSAADAMTDEERRAVAMADPDAVPMTDEEWAEAPRVAQDQPAFNRNRLKAES